MTSGPTIRDVAERAGVSTATVSRVLNGLPGFSEETKRRVKKAIRELGYRRNAVARNLKTRESNTIAVLLPRFKTAFAVEILDGIEDAAQSAGYSVMVCHVGASGSRTQEYINMLQEKQVDGIIGCSLPPREKADTLMADSGIPSILVSTLSFRRSIPYIKVDDFQASYSATRYLIQKGHRKIAMLAGSKEDVVAGFPRLNGYRQALSDARLIPDEHLVRYTDFSFSSGLEAARSLLRECRPPGGFTALVACSDETAVAAISAAYEAGLSVPKDFSVIGYDNSNTAEMSVPPLTSISQPLYLMGQKAFSLLLRRIRQDKTVSSEILPFQIVERKSVRNISI